MFLLVLTYPGSPRQKAIKQCAHACVCQRHVCHWFKSYSGNRRMDRHNPLHYRDLPRQCSWSMLLFYCHYTKQWGAGMVICLERVADLHMSQLMPLPLTVSCFSKIQIGFTFLVPAHLGSPGKRAVKWVCVCIQRWPL